MELGSILQFLEHRSILVTGGTGFLAKIFVEKIVRVQPNVKKLHLLLRASDTNSAMLRFNNEIIEKELFKVLKEKNGANLNTLIEEKVRVVAGDVTFENLGVKDLSLLEEMLTEIEVVVVVNLAANTNFDERYNVSLGINTHGAIHVLNFSKKMKKLKIMVHVSTAYVSGEREGLILETPCVMGETLNGTHGLDIDVEKKLIEETLEQLKDTEHGLLLVFPKDVPRAMSKNQVRVAIDRPLRALLILQSIVSEIRDVIYEHLTVLHIIVSETQDVRKKIGKDLLTICLYSYDDMNTENLRRAAGKTGVETVMFYFDPKIINWDDYSMNIHIPGIVQRVFKN